MTRSSKLRVGEWVEVRRKDEILKTLDKNAQLDGMPFMPEMFAFCGKRFQVHKRAHKTCDTVFPIRSRRVPHAVHLDARCNGEAHGGCQAGCLIFWNEAWLKRVEGEGVIQKSSQAEVASERIPLGQGTGCSEQDVWARARAALQPDEQDSAYVCQATQLPYATSALVWWDLRQYIEDFTSGNVGIWQILKGTVYSAYFNLSQAGIGLGSAMRWFWDRFHSLWGGTLFPRKTGIIPLGQPTPRGNLDLKPGELVRVKSHEEILKTVNINNQNRGMYWDAELVPYCGRTFRVLKRVNKIVDEKTGKLVTLKGDCIILEGVYCQSRYSGCRMFCPRSIYSYWREIWLERVSEGDSMVAPVAAGKMEH